MLIGDIRHACSRPCSTGLNGFRLQNDRFKKECEKIREIFSGLNYPEVLLNVVILSFFKNQDTTKENRKDLNDQSVNILLPFKDQKSADVVSRRLNDLSRKTGQQLRPVYISPKRKDQVMKWEPKPSLISQQCVVYYFKCDQCEPEYVG